MEVAGRKSHVLLQMLFEFVVHQGVLCDAQNYSITFIQPVHPMELGCDSLTFHQDSSSTTDC